MKLKTQSSVVGVARTTANFPLLPRPRFADTLRFPADITELTAANVSELLGKYTQLYAYANQELALLGVRLLRVQFQRDIRRNEIFRKRPGLNGIERWRRDAVLDEDSQMEQLGAAENLIERQKVMLQMAQTNFDRYLVALSRELTRKTTEGFPARTPI
jgi:hypothetical protein